MREPPTGNTPDTPRSETVSTKQRRIEQLARERPETAFTTLSHHIDLDWLKEAYAQTRKDGAAGVDGLTAADYEANLEANLQDLLNRAKSGTYRAPPVRRVHIPKGDGETRPLGIPTLEDKILQRAVLMVLGPLYEVDFSSASYGFRPGRSAHQALGVIRAEAMAVGGGWVADVDLRKYFDTIDHGHLREFLRRRVRDGVLLRLIGKWLNAGVLEDGGVTYPSQGTPQGGVISPLLANLYLHYVLDEWFERDVKPRLRDRASLIRYADDFLLIFAREADARRVMDVLPKRMARYGLTVHPEKSRLVDFRVPLRGRKTSDRDDEPGNETFDFLGFTHYWCRSRRGFAVVKRSTARGRLARALRSIWDWCRAQRHESPRAQHATLSRKLLGHYAYYGIPGNYIKIREFQYYTTLAWRYWLGRRHRDGALPWREYTEFLRRYPLPKARIMHDPARLASNLS